MADEGFEVGQARTLAQARAVLHGDQPPTLMLADLNLPDGSATELIPEAREASCEVVLITGEATVDSAVDSLRLGAMDYLEKPVDVSRLTALLNAFLRTSRLAQRVTSLEEELQDAGRFAGIVGASRPMRELYKLLQKVAPTDTTVMVVGESGTGKELVALAVHNLSSRSQGAFLPINCGAVSETLIESELFGHEKGSFTGADRRREGLFERADGGTLFLDEVTEMPVELQVKLLRVLENREVRRVGGERPISVDVRIIAATNRDPMEAVERGELREDLYYRLRVFPLELPPLRERSGDVEILSRHFLTQLNRRDDRRVRWSDDAIDAAERYPWPGNVRELKNAVERAYILADDVISEDLLPSEVLDGAGLEVEGPRLHVHVGSTIEEVERRLILATVKEMDGRRQEAADALGISVKTLYNRLKQYESDSS